MLLLTHEKSWTDRNTAVALGTFDGVHVGHQKLMKVALEKAKEYKLTSMVYTYSNHPMSVFLPESVPKQLQTSFEKVRSIAFTGVETIVLRPFDLPYSKLSIDDFVLYLSKSLKPRFVIIGFNFSFGNMGRGTPDDMETLGKKHGFETIVLGKVSVDNQVVSSSAIRNCLEKKDIITATKLLGHPYTLSGSIRCIDVKNRNIFIEIDVYGGKKKMLPAAGFYNCILFYKNTKIPIVSEICEVDNIHIIRTVLPDRFLLKLGETVRLVFKD